MTYRDAITGTNRREHDALVLAMRSPFETLREDPFEPQHRTEDDELLPGHFVGDGCDEESER